MTATQLDRILESLDIVLKTDNKILEYIYGGKYIQHHLLCILSWF